MGEQRWGDALELLSAFPDLVPRSYPLLWARGWAHFKLGDPETAQELSRSALELLDAATVGGAEVLLHRHWQILEETHPDEAKDARLRAQRVIRERSARILDPDIREKYLASRAVKKIMEG